MDRTVVTCLDASGRWRRARISVAPATSGAPASSDPLAAPVIGNSNNGDDNEGRGPNSRQFATHDSGDEDRLILEYLDPARAAAAVPLESGIVTGGFTDWHVHLHLADWAALAESPITRVHDLGGDPASLSRIAAGAAFGTGPVRPFEVLHAGAFLTPPGGYPSDRSWAPSGTYREVADVRGAAAAVKAMAAAGASAIKIASNLETGPVFSDEMFKAIVASARELGLPVVVHAEGTGEALRAARLGATRLAHAPFSERLSDDELAELAARTSWCSTLDIHGWGEHTQEYEIAVANVAGFVRHGGTLLYGTDMGNGPTPVGLNSRELSGLAAAGLTPEQQLAALTPGDPLRSNAELVWVPRGGRGELDLAKARRLRASDIHESSIEQ